VGREAVSDKNRNKTSLRILMFSETPSLSTQDNTFSERTLFRAGGPTYSCSGVFLGLTITRRDDPPSPRLRRDNTSSPVPLRVHQRRTVQHKVREPARRQRYDGRGNIPTLTIQRVGHPAAWIGLRASFRVVPMRRAESGTYRSSKDGPPAN